MRILILNWRDIKNPSSGGAEILTHEIAKRLVEMGNTVTQFSSGFEGGLKEEEVDKVKIVRRGHADARYLIKSVHFLAYLYYQKIFKGKFDVVIDEIHGIPFFTPFYVQEKKVALICEVADKIWDIQFSFPFNKIGKTIERSYFSFYKNILFITISRSTKKSLIKMGVKETNIYVLPMGITLPTKTKTYLKNSVPTLIFVGRLSKTKGVEDAIYVFKKIRKDLPHCNLWIVGRGEKNYERYLKNLALELGIKDGITFFGFVSDERKFELLGKSHVLLAPSVKEGWGLIVGEAGIMRTPSIAYNVSGLRDAIIDKKTGIIVDNKDEMAAAVSILLKDEKTYKEFQKGTYNLSKSYDWNKTARSFLSLLAR